MYLDYFGLKEKPFSLSPDPRYLYYSRSHKEALAQMIYAATQDTGFMMLTGEVGTGKTILINALINQFPNYSIANIVHSASNPEGLIRNICKEFKVHSADGTLDQLVLKLQDFLKWNYNAGTKSILILDEAQNLETATLEEIRLLSNFESASKKYIQVYLIGQPELEEKLWNENLRQLRSRISLKFRLASLNREETKRYIVHRMRVAGMPDKRRVFDEKAMNKVFEMTAGIPRQINILCDHALLIAYSNLFNTIDTPMVEMVGNFNRMEHYTAKKKPAPQAAAPVRPPGPARRTDTPAVATPPPDVRKIPPATKQPAPGNGNGSPDYKNIEKILRQYAESQQILLIKKPKAGRIFFSVVFAFVMLVLAFFLALLIAVKSGILE